MTKKSQELLIFKEGKDFFTTSLDIAEKFDRSHRHVLDSIQSLQEEEFSRPNFRLSNYIKRGKEYPCFFITKDGFALLAMGFTGKKALKWKIKYLTAFNYLIEENEKLKKQLERHKRDSAWIAAREENTDRNKDFNAAIADFQKYAAESGSQNAKRYFMLFNDMVNHNLFTFPKGMKNIPDKLEKFQLNFRDSTTKVVMDLIRAGIEKSVHYKELFLLCKAKVVEIAKALGVTPVPLIEGGQYELLK